MLEIFRTYAKGFMLVLVVLLAVSFVFVGTQNYRQDGGANGAVAKVDGVKITQAEWDMAHRNQIERLRQQMPKADLALLDSPAMRAQTLEGLVRDRVMLTAVDKLHLVVTDDQLQRQFVSDPQFAFLRNPDGSVNKELLAAQGMSSEMFAQRLRQDLATRQVLAGVAGSAMGPDTVTATALDAMFQQREIQVQRFDAKTYVARLNPTDAELEAFYNDASHAALFQAPERATAQVVLLDLDAIKKQVTVSDADLHKYYDENVARFTSPEERRAAHILIKAEKSAPAADRAKAKAKAEALLAEVQKNPASFADVARKNSEDPGSAANGGDLDFFGRGAMVKPFEDVAFTLKPGEISGIVESDFGYHIIRLTAVRGGDKRSFESVRTDIENEVKTQLAQRRYAEMAEQFTNTVFEQSDSLKPVADALKLEVRTVDNVTRVPAAGVTGPLANAKLLERLYADDTLRNKRNTEAVEVGANQLASARIVKYEAAHKMSFAEVKTQVRDQVIAAMAAAAARKDGQAKLAQLKQAADTALTGASVVVSRAQARDVPPPVIDAALKADATTLPLSVGVDLGDQGYAVVKVLKVLGRDPVVADVTRAKAEYAQAWGAAESRAYYDALKARYKVQITTPVPSSSSDEPVR
ncbi:MAG: peptidylprolyl isomerase [Rhizobacter sp.]|nr:peptidylprolyl isomerase [Rhizobacter sp.]